MKKLNNILKTLGVTATAGTIVLFAACSNENTTAQTPVNQAPATNGAVQTVESQNISLEKAVEIALDNAGISKEDARFTKTSIDNNDRIPHYEIEFIAGNTEYDYDISISDGRILETDKEAENNIPPVSVPAHTNTPAESEKTQAAANPQSNNGYISVDEAKSIALNAAGVAAEDARFEKAAFDYDDRIAHYDIEFYANGYEYDFEINAETAAIIKNEKERENYHHDDYHRNTVPNAENYINAEAAKQKALAHAKLNAADVKYIKAELDNDDRIAHYEVEFRSGRFEYDYSVNAITGEIISFEKEIDD